MWKSIDSRVPPIAKTDAKAEVVTGDVPLPVVGTVGFFPLVAAEVPANTAESRN